MMTYVAAYQTTTAQSSHCKSHRASHSKSSFVFIRGYIHPTFQPVIVRQKHHHFP
jgi:hypothetical protein